MIYNFKGIKKEKARSKIFAFTGPELDVKRLRKYLTSCAIYGTITVSKGVLKWTREFIKKGEELQLYFHFKKRGFRINNKKGKGSYNRKKKHIEREEF